MLYSEYISKAKAMCIAIDDVNDVSYLIPDYRYLLSLSELNLEDVTDFPGVSYDIVADNLRAEVDAYNTRHNMVPGLAAWIRETLFQALSPIAVQEQNELFSNVIEYMKAKNQEEKTKQEHSSEEQNKASEQKDAVLESKGENVQGKIIQMSEYMNFAKKE